MAKDIAGIKPTSAQVTTAWFSALNAICNLVFVIFVLVGGIAVHTVYLKVSHGTDEGSINNAKMMFSDATYFVHQARLKYQVYNETLPLDIAQLTQSASHALDSVAAVMGSVDRAAIYNATTRLGHPDVQAFIGESVQKLIADIQHVQLYVDTLSSLVNRLSIMPGINITR